MGNGSSRSTELAAEALADAMQDVSWESVRQILSSYNYHTFLDKVSAIVLKLRQSLSSIASELNVAETSKKFPSW